MSDNFSAEGISVRNPQMFHPVCFLQQLLPAAAPSDRKRDARQGGQ